MAILPSAKKGKADKCFDPKIRVSEGGIRYRWAFLAKSHVFSKSAPEGPTARDGSFGAFGCIFCCAEGKGRGWEISGMATPGSGGALGGAPIFGNIGSFMEHLEMHRKPEGTPGVEMQGRVKCIVGRVAEPTEEFDLNLPPL